MGSVQAEKRPICSIRQLDHDAVGARLDASLCENCRLSREAGPTRSSMLSVFGIGPAELAAVSRPIRSYRTTV